MNPKTKSPPAVTVKGFTLQPVTPDLRDNLLEINSPLIIATKYAVALLKNCRPIERDAKMKALDDNIEAELGLRPGDMDGTIFVFLNDQTRVKELLAKGKKHFKNTVEIEISRKINPFVLPEIFRKASEMFVQSLKDDFCLKSPDGPLNDIFNPLINHP